MSDRQLCQRAGKPAAPCVATLALFQLAVLKSKLNKPIWLAGYEGACPHCGGGYSVAAKSRYHYIRDGELRVGSVPVKCCFCVYAAALLTYWGPTAGGRKSYTWYLTMVPVPTAVLHDLLPAEVRAFWLALDGIVHRYLERENT